MLDSFLCVGLEEIGEENTGMRIKGSLKGLTLWTVQVGF